MKVGVFLPVSGRAASGVLMEAARRAEALGFASVWAADRIVTPWESLFPGECYCFNCADASAVEATHQVTPALARTVRPGSG